MLLLASVQPFARAGAGESAQSLAPRSYPVVLKADQPATCDVYSPERLGLRKIGEQPFKGEEDRSIALHILVYRVPANGGESEAQAASGPYRLTYKDYVFAFQLRDQTMIDLQRQFLVKYDIRVPPLTCVDIKGRSVAMYAYLTERGANGEYAFPALAATYIFDIFLPDQAGGVASGQPAFPPAAESDPDDLPASPPLPTPKPAVEASPAAPPEKNAEPPVEVDAGLMPSDPVDPKQEAAVPAEPGRVTPYAWVADFQLKRFTKGEEVFVLDRADCSPDGNFFVGSTAEVLELPQAQGEQRVHAARRAMYAAAHNYGQGGDPSVRSVVENSVDPTHYWCIPRQEFCYRPIGFGQFGVAASTGEVKDFDEKSVYNLRLGLVSALQAIAVDRCLGAMQLGEKKE